MLTLVPIPAVVLQGWVWPPMRDTLQGGLQRSVMALGCPVPVSVWQEEKGEGISQILPPSLPPPPPSQGANVVLGVQQMGLDGSPAPCLGKAGGSAPGGGQLEGK